MAQGTRRGDCYFGVPVDANYGRQPLLSIPTGTTVFHFLGGLPDRPVLDALLRSPFSKAITVLNVGTSSYGENRPPLDYQGHVALLARARLPRLRWLGLGDDERFVNQSRAFGTVGDVTPLLRVVPTLEELTLCGRFELTTAVDLPALEHLDVTVDDGIMMSGGPLAAATVDHLLASHLPRLRTLELDLRFFGDSDADERRSPTYTLPAALLAGTATPLLAKLTVAGRFAPTAREALAVSPLARRPGLRLNTEWTD